MKHNLSGRSTAFRFDCYACSQAGPESTNNEDAAAVDPDNGVFVVADGMGGRPEGALASRVAAKAFLDTILGFRGKQRLRTSALEKAIRAANVSVLRCSRLSPMRNGMGTTLSAAVVAGNAGRVVHVGDTRIYLYHAGRLEQITRDHTLAQELAGRQRLSEDCASAHPLGHVLSRTVGTRAYVVPDIQEFALLPGDGLILTSDGVSRVLRREELRRIARKRWRSGARPVCEALLQHARAKQPADDLTIIVTKLVSENGSALC